ncbi:MAG: MerR family transcriptional regulator [Alkalilacustris sp.]
MPQDSDGPVETLLGIGEMCALHDVTPRTLRFYEQKGLLTPERRGRSRLYRRRDRARLALILRGRRFGFSLDQIGALLDLYDRDDRQLTQLRRTYDVACARLADMERQRAELDEAIAELRAELAWGADVLARATGPALQEEAEP